MKVSSLIFVIGLMLIFLVGIFLIFYYFQKQSNECINSPLVYGAKQMEESFGYTFTGIGFLHTPPNIRQPKITFNSTAISIE